MYEYKIISKWSGWFGGFGSERDISAMINAEAGEGWRLLRSETGRFFWFYIPFVPRKRLLLIFERAAAAQPAVEHRAEERAAAEASASSASSQAPAVRMRDDGPFARRS